MAWNLEVTTIDVGQGESSLIYAYDDTINQRRAMLIDGGKQGQAQAVNQMVTTRLGPQPVDHIVVTHYDVDHSGGIINLLEADNFYVICKTLADAGELHGKGNTGDQVVVAASAAICATILGCYNDFWGQDYSAQAADIAADARADWANTAPGIDPAEFGTWYAENNVNLPLNNSLVPTTFKRRQAAIGGGRAVWNAINSKINVFNNAFETIFNCLRTVVSSRPQFNTEGRFNKAQLIDTGNLQMPNNYLDFVRGYVYMSNTAVRAPGINRTRLSAGYGSEILWNSGPNSMPAPANAPAVFVMARNGYVWNGVGNGTTKIAGIGIDNNKDSYGLVLRFNNFFFYTGGDLIAEGEDLIAKVIMSRGLPNPAGGLYPPPHRIAAFKCGHHGANTCTSQTFLNTIDPRAVLISTGQNSFDHPAQPLVDRLNAGNPFYFYLTGCYPYRNHIPATYNPPQNQLLGANKSRVAGGEDRPPGNVMVALDQAHSMAGGAVPRSFDVVYFEYDNAPSAYRTEVNLF